MSSVMGSCLEEHPCLDHIPFVKREAVIDASRKEHEVTGIDYEPDPLVGGLLCPIPR